MYQMKTIASILNGLLDQPLEKLPKNDFTRKMIYFDTQELADLGKLINDKGFRKLLKVQ